MSRKNNRNNRNSRNDNYDKKKRSGAQAKQYVTKDGVTGLCINAWNYNNRRGMVKVSAFENSKSVESESKTGNKFIMMMFEIFYVDTGAKVLELANYNKTTGKVFLTKLGMVISTKAANGGYFGKA